MAPIPSSGSLFLVKTTFLSLSLPLLPLTVLLLSFYLMDYESSFVATACIYIITRTIPFTIYTTYFAYHSCHRLGLLLGIITAMATAFFLTVLVIGAWSVAPTYHHDNNPLATTWAYLYTDLNAIDQVSRITATTTTTTTTTTHPPRP